MRDGGQVLLRNAHRAPRILYPETRNPRLTTDN